MNSKLIIALDYDKASDALKLIDEVDPKQCALKIGSELFTRFGSSFVKQVIDRQFKVFLDLKFHDIPNTVAQACKACADLEVWMINVHALGGFKMMQAAKKALESYGEAAPLLIAVTVLTSAAEEELLESGITNPLSEQVTLLAQLAQSAGLDGVVCSAHEVSNIKTRCGQSFISVTPGIRLSKDKTHDQQRIMTPKAAIEAGSDFLVMGRSITHSENPGYIIESILKTLA